MYDFPCFPWDFDAPTLLLTPMTTTYAVPTNPVDPEAAALELIVRLPAKLLGSDSFTPVLQDYCSLLHAESAFAGLSWNDAR